MELASLTLAELAADLRAKKISSLELCEAAIERHEGQGKKLNAYRDWAPERARTQARAADQAFAAGRDLGPLQGLPQSIKDIYGVPGYETFTLSWTIRQVSGGSQEPESKLSRIRNYTVQ